ncbi:MAG: serine protease AprX [Actinomycetota bacterium]
MRKAWLLGILTAALVALNPVAPAAHAANGVTVAVLDTGIDAAHAAFAGAGPIGFKDFVNNRSTAYDDNGHGTIVSSMIVGSGTTPASLASGTTLAVGKVLDSSGSGGSDAFVAGIHWAVDTVHADIINMSLGSYIPGTSVLDTAVYDALAYARAHNVLVVVANGNGLANLGAAPSLGWAHSFGNSADVLSVGASGVDGLLVNTDPDVAAVFTVTGAAANTGSGYVTESGTSFGSPYTAGYAARLLSASRTGGHPLTASGLETLVEYTARDTVMPPVQEGYGVIDAAQLPAALNYAASGTLPPAPGTVNATYTGRVVPLLRTVGRTL